ncbi:hypothetical protein [Dyella sp.]|uniref:hypothetical protein n=1 Tax=Dyella sp. TaxID=1869338 RepID=UPI003F7F2551
MFPAGGAGLGLALLRCSLALALAGVVPSASLLTSLAWWMPALALACGALLLGVLTPLVSIAAVVNAAVTLLTEGGDRWEQNLLVLLMAGSLTLIGPGAYSLDARIYGRHRVLPRKPRG